MYQIIKLSNNEVLAISDNLMKLKRNVEDLSLLCPEEMYEIKEIENVCKDNKSD